MRRISHAAFMLALVASATFGLAVRVRGQQLDSSPIPPSVDVDAQFADAEKLLRAQNLNEAKPRFERLLGVAHDAGLERQQAEALAALGEIAYQNGEYAPGRELGSRAAEIYERLKDDRGLGRASQLLGLLAELQGQTTEAAARFTRAVAAFESVGDVRGRAMATLGLLESSSLTLEQQIPLYERSMQDARSVGDNDLEGRTLHSWGDHLFTSGDYPGALEKLEQAGPLFDAARDLVALGTVYNSLGRLYRAHGQIETALANQLKALAIHEKSNSPFNHLQSLNAVAVTYQLLGDSRNARTYFERALALAQQSSTPRIQDFLRANLATTIMDDGDYTRAAEILEGVVARGVDTYPGPRSRELSAAYLKLGRPEQALASAQKAVDLCSGRDLDCLSALDERAEVYAALGNDSAALSDVRAALEKIETVRARLVPADFFKQQFSLAQEDIYSHAIALQLKEGQRGEALETAELARSRAFVDLLASRNLQSKDEPPSALRASAAESSNLPVTGALPLVFRGAAPDTTTRTPSGGATAGPAPFDLPSEVAASAAAASDLVATAARLHSTMLVYWVTDDTLFIWVVTPEGPVRAAQVDVRRSKLAELIRATAPFPESADSTKPRPAGVVATRGAMSIALQPTPANAWRQLYDVLIGPIRDALPRAPGALLTVVPHGPLTALAFAALQNERGRYLLEDYTLHYVPAGAVLRFTAAKRHPDSRSGSVLLVADPVPPALSTLDGPLPRLPGARAETRAIAGVVPRARVTMLQGDGATESAVRLAASGKTVLHFATHAIVHDEDPFSSFLALGSTTGANSGDGLLTAQEIYGLNLDTDLVVLSACRSAGGRVTGDGIATFARAFIYAGAPSLVASLWDVADEPTNRLLPDFYRAWFGGASKARALRTAQLRLLSDLRANKVTIETPAGRVSLPELPVFWAGFALLGEPD